MKTVGLEVDFSGVCLRMALQQKKPPLEDLGLRGVQSRSRSAGYPPTGKYAGGRFDSPGLPVLYAALEQETCEAEVKHHLLTNHLLRRPGTSKRIRYVLLELDLAGRFNDVRKVVSEAKWLRDPDGGSYPRCRAYALVLFKKNFDGILYGSVRRRKGSCLGRFLTPGVVIPTKTIREVVYFWNGTNLAKV